MPLESRRTRLFQLSVTHMARSGPATIPAGEPPTAVSPPAPLGETHPISPLPKSLGTTYQTLPSGPSAIGRVTLLPRLNPRATPNGDMTPTCVQKDTPNQRFPSGP